MKKLVVFGDSCAKGIVTDSGRPLPAKPCAVDILGEKLLFDEVENISAFGQTIVKLSERKFVERYIEAIKPGDKVYSVIWIGGNDVDYDWRQVALSPDYPHSSKTGLCAYSEILHNLTAKLKKVSEKVFLVTLLPVNSQRYFDSVISKIADGNAVLKFLDGDVTNISRKQEMFNIEVVKTAYETEVGLIDLRTKLLMLNDCFDYYCADGIHLSQTGQRLAATIISEIIDNEEKSILRSVKNEKFSAFV